MQLIPHQRGFGKAGLIGLAFVGPCERLTNRFEIPEPFLFLDRLILHIPKKSNNFGKIFLDWGFSWAVSMVYNGLSIGIPPSAYSPKLILVIEIGRSRCPLTASLMA
jgi:hypothetical protein